MNKQLLATKVYELVTERKYTCIARLLLKIDFSKTPMSIINAIHNWINEQLNDAHLSITAQQLEQLFNTNNVLHLPADDMEEYKITISKCNNSVTLEILYSEDIDVHIKPF